MPGPLERLLFFVLLLTLAWGVAMNVQAHGIAPAEEVPAGCYFSGQPIVDVELAQSSECFVAVTTVRGDDETADELATRIARNLKLFRANTRMDFFFIALYWLVFVLFGWATDNGRVKWLLLAFVTLSSAFDVAENVRILAGLSSVTHQTAVDHLLFSKAKPQIRARTAGVLGKANPAVRQELGRLDSPDGICDQVAKFVALRIADCGPEVLDLDQSFADKHNLSHVCDPGDPRIAD